MSGVRRIIMAVLGQASGSVAPPSSIINPSSWNGYFNLPGPWGIQRDFSALASNNVGVTTYQWSWEEISATGGANMQLLPGDGVVDGQGTPNVTWRANCPGTNLGGGGELFGNIVVAITDENGTTYASANVGLSFGFIP